jgi:hypothetical protein
VAQLIDRTPECNHLAVAEWHLRDLQHALEQRRWAVVSETRWGDRWGISGSWEIERGIDRLWLDFQGGDYGGGLVTHPLESAHACEVRGMSSTSLYFRKRRSLELWRADLQRFLDAVDAPSGE